ncbi:MAG: hypothetical protein ACRD2E_10670 [Terriglobales bacterium]
MGKSFTDSSGQTSPEILLGGHEAFTVFADPDLASCPAPLRFAPLDGATGSPLLLEFGPDNGPRWQGAFAGEPSGRYRTAVVGCADPNTACVVSNGRAYLVDVSAPARFEVLPILPVTCVATGPLHELVALASCTDVIAIGSGGVIWRARGVSKDGIRSLRVDPDGVRGRAWSPAAGEFDFALAPPSGLRMPEPAGPADRS